MKRISIVSAAALGLVLLAGCSSTPAHPKAAVSTNAPTPTPHPTAVSEATYLTVMRRLYTSASDPLLTAIGQNNCDQLTIGKTFTELKAIDLENTTVDVVTVELGIRAAVATYCPQYADRL